MLIISDGLLYGIFINERPLWIDVIYPGVIHPMFYMFRFCTAYMLVVISIERFVVLSNSLAYKTKCYSYILLVILCSCEYILTIYLIFEKRFKNYISFLQLHVTYHDFFIMSTNMMSLAIVLIWLHLFIEIKCIIYFGTHGNHLFIHSYPLSHCAPLMVKYCGTWQNLTKMMQKSVRIMV